MTQVVEIGNHLRKTLQPGVASNIERTAKAIQGKVTPSGRKYDINNEMAAWVGWRASELDPQVALYYRSYEFKDAKKDATRALNRLMRSGDEVSDEQLRDAFQHATSLRQRAYKDMFTLIQAAERSGLNRLKIQSVLRNSGISKVDTASLLQGRVPRYEATKSSLRYALKKADVLFKPEQRQRIQERYRLVNRFSQQTGPMTVR